ncbi:4f804d27-16d2-4608-b393-f7878d1ff44e [Sclerotinia trifoliorum]|uniref:4f804d27-16d2-4608-b393-f7878d1ff44e n=1 Tax=Sclerotinia trifoliorum TaxID=28548 RepID=A0A8H2VL36_9HELO|nr:4f804d27-16d2-4608-b393-f7878d1ff44e [Sclerotinia trifoliorum]
MYYHATNKFEGWIPEFKPKANISQPLTLVILYKSALYPPKLL